VLNLGAKASQIIYANPCKGDEHILFAKEKGVNLMTFDSAEEALNIKRLHPKAEVVLRIQIEDTDSP
jgi:ornithine decarboxylase